MAECREEIEVVSAKKSSLAFRGRKSWCECRLTDRRSSLCESMRHLALLECFHALEVEVK